MKQNLLLFNQETERLQFRKIEKSDFDAWKPLFDAPQSAGFLGLDSALSKEELTQKYFDKVFYRYENKLGGMNALIEKSSGKLIGQCGLLIQTIDNIDYVEIGYAVLPQYWGMGYATEAAKKCRDSAFENNLTQDIISIINTDNYGSMEVAKRNGMEIARNIPDYHGSNINLWKITKEKWLSIYKKPNCEKCSTEYNEKNTAYHCAHNCTFCQSCSYKMNLICPNCKGELVKR